MQSILAYLLGGKVGKFIDFLTQNRGPVNVINGKVGPGLLKPQRRRKPMTKKDLLLSVLAAAEGKPLSPIQLQKAVFLVQENCPYLIEGERYEFVPHNYGPFCKEIYKDIESYDLLDSVKEHRQSGHSWRDYSATEQGIEKASQLPLSDEIKRYIKQVADWVLGLSFDELVRAIYKAYPTYRVNSIFRG